MAIRVLIADDHAVFRSGLRALLEAEADIDVVGEAASGSEALTLLDNVECDVLLLDVSMPGMPGTRVAEMVQRRRPDVAVLVLTMHEDTAYLQAMLEAGARGYLVKKSTDWELMQALRAVHRGDNYIDPLIAGTMMASLANPGNQTASGDDTLTAREREVCALIAYGHTSSEIAEMLSLSARTVETHRQRVTAKANCKTRADIVRYAIDNGLMTLE